MTSQKNISQQKCLKKLDFENLGIQEYLDLKVKRQGFLFQLTKEKYEKSGIHIYYYE